MAAASITQIPAISFRRDLQSVNSSESRGYFQRGSFSFALNQPDDIGIRQRRSNIDFLDVGYADEVEPAAQIRFLEIRGIARPVVTCARVDQQRLLARKQALVAFLLRPGPVFSGELQHR